MISLRRPNFVFLMFDFFSDSWKSSACLHCSTGTELPNHAPYVASGTPCILHPLPLSVSNTYVYQPSRSEKGQEYNGPKPTTPGVAAIQPLQCLEYLDFKPRWPLLRKRRSRVHTPKVNSTLLVVTIKLVLPSKWPFRKFFDTVPTIGLITAIMRHIDMPRKVLLFGFLFGCVTGRYLEREARQYDVNAVRADYGYSYSEDSTYEPEQDLLDSCEDFPPASCIKHFSPLPHTLQRSPFALRSESEFIKVCE